MVCSHWLERCSSYIGQNAILFLSCVAQHIILSMDFSTVLYALTWFHSSNCLVIILLLDCLGRFSFWHRMSNSDLISEVDTDLDGGYDLSDIPSPRSHQPLSPANPAESFFLSPELRTSNVSAFALAAQIHRNRNSGKVSSGRSIASGQSVVTNDFISTCEYSFDFNAGESSFIHNYNESLFGKDVLIYSREPILEDEEFDYQDANENMTDPISNSEQGKTVNAAQQVYEAVKGIWLWGKRVPILGFAEGVAEAVAKKVVSAAGTSLEDIDAHVKPHLRGLDNDFLNPAFNKVVSIILAGIGKGDETFRPIFMTIVPPVLGPLGLMKIEEEKEFEKVSKKKLTKKQEPISSIISPEITTITAE